MILDSHIHLWGDAVATAHWLEGRAGEILRRTFTLSDYEQARHELGADVAIAVTAEQSVAETVRLVHECAASSIVLGVVGWVDLTDETSDVAAGIVGIRHSVIAEAEGWLDRPDVRSGIRAFARTGLVLELLVAARDLPAVARCARDFPQLVIVVDHLGSPPSPHDGLSLWETDLAMLGLHQNVRMKVSDPRVSARSVEVAFNLFGPGRLMFGSNWPVSQLALSPTRERQWFRDLSDSLSARERAQFFSETAVQVYGLAR